MQQAVDAAEVDEGAVVGDVLDRALEDDALFEDLERLLLEDRPLLFQDGPAADHDVTARAVELEHREPPPLTDVAIEVAGGADVGVGAWQEGGDADVDLETTLHLADDHPLDHALAVERQLDVPPDLELHRLLVRQHDLAGLGVGVLEEDVDRVPFVHRELALTGGEFLTGDLSLGLVADVDRHDVGTDPHHAAGHDVSRLRASEALLEHRGKVLVHPRLLAGCVGDFGHQAGTP